MTLASEIAELWSAGTPVIYLVTDEEERARGLMFRDEMAPDHGMIFIHDFEEPQSYYDALAPLAGSIVFVEERGQIRPATYLGKGKVVLYGPRVQCRGQTVGTFKLLFNAILRSSMEK